MLLCATLTTAAAALLALALPRNRDADRGGSAYADSRDNQYRAGLSEISARGILGALDQTVAAGQACATYGNPDLTARMTGSMARGPLQRLSARGDLGGLNAYPPRGCRRGAAALKTWRVVIAVGCVSIGAAGCSSGLPGSTAASATPVAPTTSAVKDPLIPGIGATRADWDASHTPNPAFNKGMVYGENPGLPTYLAAHGAIYIEVFDLGTGRIQSYNLNMRAAGRHQALARVRQELPSDAKVAWDLRLNHCYRVAFASATLEAAGHYMAEVQLDFLKADATTAMSPHSFNRGSFQLDVAGSPPNPVINCGHRIRESTVDLRAGTLRPAG
jgi:hypothetical protein